MACSEFNIQKGKKELIEVDLRFSEYSENYGMQKAFIHFCHPNGVLLKAGRMPVEGKEQVKKLMEQTSGSEATLTWEPVFADIAGSGDMGYTYGTYQLKTKTGISEGTYCSVWKKDDQGNWKYVLDTGNQGLGK